MSGNFIGVDPDMHFVSFWLLSGDGIPLARHTVEIKKTGRESLVDLAKGLEHAAMFNLFAPFGAIDAAAVESQELYQFGPSKTKNPKSIMQLATAAGIIMGALSRLTTTFYFPAPQAWKGSVPKAIHHARICRRLGWQYVQSGGQDGYCVPLCSNEKLGVRLASHWKHAMDSIGLALYARDTFIEDEKRKARAAL